MERLKRFYRVLVEQGVPLANEKSIISRNRRWGRRRNGGRRRELLVGLPMDLGCPTGVVVGAKDDPKVHLAILGRLGDNVASGASVETH